MQSAREAAASAKEIAANIGAAAGSGMEKTRAAAHEKADRMAAHDQLEKDLATERKHERMDEAELLKREAYDQNAAAREQAAFTGHSAPTTTGGHHMTGAAGTHPTPQQDPRVGGYYDQRTAGTHPTTQLDPRLGGY